MAINEKIQCSKCKGTVFKLYGVFREDYGWEIILKCAQYDCKQILNYSEPFFEIIEKGLQCYKCNKYTLDRNWDKNKRGYKEKCYNCGFEHFEPES